VPTAVTQVVDYSFESSLHLFCVGDVVDVKQLAPLHLSPRRKVRRKHLTGEEAKGGGASREGTGRGVSVRKFQLDAHRLNETRNPNPNPNTYASTSATATVKVTSPQRLRRSVHATRATVVLAANKNLFADGLLNRVPFDTGRGAR
jgi:hypothetical protein